MLRGAGKYFNIFGIIFLLFIDLLLILEMVRYFEHFEHSEINFELKPCQNRLKFGDKIPKINFIDLDTLKYKIFIFAFFIPESRAHQDRLYGFDLVVSKYKNVKLISIGQGELNWLFRAGFILENSIIIDDKNLDIWKGFGVDFSCGGTVIINKVGVVLFSYHGLISHRMLDDILKKKLK